MRSRSTSAPPSSPTAVHRPGEEHDTPVNPLPAIAPVRRPSRGLTSTQSAPLETSAVGPLKAGEVAIGPLPTARQRSVAVQESAETSPPAAA